MHRSTLLRTAGGLVLSVVLAACAGTPPSGGTATASPPRATPVSPAASATAPGYACADALRDATPITFSGDSTGQIGGYLFGSGSTAVIFSNQSNEDLCGWLPYAQGLADDGFTTLVYDYAGRRDANEKAAAAELRHRGATHLLLVGASAGANSSLYAATGIEPAIDGVVALSAEDAVGIKLLAVPVLFVVAEHDPYVSADHEQALFDAAASTDKAIHVLTGDDHGTSLLRGSVAEQARDLVTTFLVDHSGR